MVNKLQDGFDGASLKVERAYRHIDELQSIIESIGSLTMDALAVTKDPDGRHVLNFASAGPAAKHIPLAIGDAIHNMRTALDHVWMALLRINHPTKKEYFPFHETRENLVDAITKSLVYKSFPEVENLILNDVKTHSDAGGNHLFWTLTKFDKIDKHNLIIPVVRVNQVQNLEIRSGGFTANFTDCNFALGGAIFKGDQPVEYEQKGMITLDVIFPEGDLLAGESVIPSLINMADATSEAVKLFRKTFL